MDIIECLLNRKLRIMHYLCIFGENTARMTECDEQYVKHANLKKTEEDKRRINNVAISE